MVAAVGQDELLPEPGLVLPCPRVGLLAAHAVISEGCGWHARATHVKKGGKE